MALRCSVFISDLHLAPSRPRIIEQFFSFLEGPARDADALYVLGDLFEYWVGDDDIDDPLNRSVSAALAGLSDKGIAINFMHGNRDLLVGHEFARRSRARLLEDPTVMDLHGTRTLLMHGDTLCTDDIEYQKFRAYARDPRNQARFLAQPVAVRHAEMGALRERSESAKQDKSGEIMDVNTAAVERIVRDSGYPPRVIHGHTHRPATHLHTIDGHTCERWVLGDWYANGSYLRCDASGCKAVQL